MAQMETANPDLIYQQAKENHSKLRVVFAPPGISFQNPIANPKQQLGEI